MRIHALLIILPIFLSSYSSFAQEEISERVDWIVELFTKDLEKDYLEKIKELEKNIQIKDSKKNRKTKNKNRDENGKKIKRLSLKKVAITGLQISNNLGEEIKEYLLKKINDINKVRTNYQIIVCKECINPRISISKDGENFIVEKGVTSDEDLNLITQFYGLQNYMEINLVHSGNSLMFLANIYSVKDRKFVTSYYYKLRYKKYREDAYIKYGLSMGPVMGIEKKGSPFSIHLFIGEQLRRSGSTGLDIHYITEQSDMKSFVSLGPSFTLNLSEIFDWYWEIGDLYWSGRLGYGSYNGQMNIGLSTGLKLDVKNRFYLFTEIIDGYQVSLFQKKKEGETEILSFPLSLGLGFGFEF